MREPSEIIAVEMPIPDEVIKLHCAMHAAGGKLYVVGGSVRDFWRSVEKGTKFAPKDYDLVTDFHPDKVIKTLKNDKNLSKIQIREVGKSFGVVLVTINDKDFEIATFREDAKTGDGRRPDHVTFSTIDKDAERRDLTMNALYYDIEKRIIIDYFNGIADIRANRVRFVGDILSRIHEDKLRIMRFARFHCRIEGNGPEQLDKETKNIIKKTSLRPEISEERIRDEFLKGISHAADVKTFISVLEELNLLQQVFFGLKIEPKMHWDWNSVAKNHPESVVSQILRYNDPGKVKDSLISLKWTVQEATNVAFLLRLHDFREEKQFVEFKKGRLRTSLTDSVIKWHIGNIILDRAVRENVNITLLFDMLSAPYPTVRGEQVIEETGLSGKALGDEMIRREIENFNAYRSSLLDHRSCVQFQNSPSS